MATLPADPTSPARQALDMWRSLYDRGLANELYAPNYARWLGGIMAGLMQAEPPTVAGDEMFADEVAIEDLVEDVAADAAGLGVVYLRPTYVDGDVWVPATIHPAMFDPIWRHKRLMGGDAWLIEPKPGEDRTAVWLLVERWRVSDDNVGTVEMTGYDGKLAEGGTVEYDPTRPIDVTGSDVPLFSRAADSAARFAGQDVRVHGFVWRWYRKLAAPVYVSNEQVVRGLEALWDQEQSDAEMIRHRVALDADMLRTQPVLGQYADTNNMPQGSRVIAQPGFNLRSNILALSSAKTGQAQAVADRVPFHVVSFPDSLTQRDRIERRENGLLELCGINPQSIGRNVGGRSDSAAAKRADQQTTLNTIAGPGRRLARTLQMSVQQCANLAAAGDVSVSITPGLRPIASDSVEMARDLYTANASTVETRVRTAHPDWSDDQVAAEVVQYQAEQAGLSMADGLPSGDLEPPEG